MAQQHPMMTYGKRFVETYNQGKVHEIYGWYSPDATSIEAVAMPGQKSPETRGLDAIKAKGAAWLSSNDLHSSVCEGPFVHGHDRFSVIFDIDVTYKETKQRIQMRELAHYTIKDDQIVREEFSFAVGE